MGVGRSAPPIMILDSLVFYNCNVLTHCALDIINRLPSVFNECAAVCSDGLRVLRQRWRTLLTVWSGCRRMKRRPTLSTQATFRYATIDCTSLGMCIMHACDFVHVTSHIFTPFSKTCSHLSIYTPFLCFFPLINSSVYSDFRNG